MIDRLCDVMDDDVARNIFGVRKIATWKLPKALSLRGKFSLPTELPTTTLTNGKISSTVVASLTPTQLTNDPTLDCDMEILIRHTFLLPSREVCFIIPILKGDDSSFFVEIPYHTP